MVRCKKYTTYLSLILLFISSVLLLSCHHKEKQTRKILTIQPTKLTKTLYFSGTIQPLSKTPVVTPIEGVVSEIFFKYGHNVQKGQLLCTINSSKQATKYETILTDYLKTKQKLITSTRKLKSTTDLFNQGLIPRNEYENTKTEHSLDQLAFSQIKSRLDTILKQYQINNLTELSITDISAVKKALELGKQSTNIKIIAPKSGTALFPKDSKTQTGTQIKEEEVLLYLADTSGISTEIEVNEMNINRLHEGQQAMIIPSIAPHVSLTGYIKSINLQATKEGSLPTFSVKIIVPKITQKQREQIHIGMSAKIAIVLNYSRQLAVPISAIFQEDMQSFVNLIDPKTKKIKKIRVTTGETTENEVIITSGLKTGDQIVLSN